MLKIQTTEQSHECLLLGNMYLSLSRYLLYLETILNISKRMKLFGFKNNFVISAFSLTIFGKISADKGIEHVAKNSAGGTKPGSTDNIWIQAWLNHDEVTQNILAFLGHSFYTNRKLLFLRL